MVMESLDGLKLNANKKEHTKDCSVTRHPGSAGASMNMETRYLELSQGKGPVVILMVILF